MWVRAGWTDLVPERIRQFLLGRVRIDTRSLAVFRMFAGVLIVVDVLLRARNLTYFYSDEGVVGQSMAMEVTPEYAFSVYYLSPDPRVTLGLFLVQILVAIQLLVGFRTRTATVLSFLFVISLDYRNPFVLSYADTLFRFLLFWAIFLPLGERWSVDALQRNRSPRPTIASLASFFILFQMVFMYVVNGINKTESEAWGSGEAAALVLGLDNITFLLGEVVRSVPTLLQVGGVVWFYMLLSAWLLILLPGRARTIYVGMFALVHLSFAVTVRIGAFPWVALLGLLPFLQAQFWNDLAAVRNRFGLGTPDCVRSRAIALGERFPEPRFDTRRIRRFRARVYTASMVVIVLSISLVALVLLANIGTIAAGDSDHRESELTHLLEETPGVQQIHSVAGIFNVQQPGWNIFAPNPRTTDRYYVFPAKTADGDLIDVYNDRPLTFERPGKRLQTQFETYRMRFYMNSIRGGEHPDIRDRLADHLCARWPDEHGVELTHVNMWFINEDVTMETLDSPADRDRRAWQLSQHVCGDGEPTDLADPDLSG